MMVRNELKAKIEAGQTVFGARIQTPHPSMVETLALSGLDFVRFDPYHVSYNRETVENMARAAFAMNVTPWARIQNEPWTIATTLDSGVMVITLPNCDTADDAKRAVAAARYPPHGDRENGRPHRFRKMSEPDYLAWAEENVWVSVQIESLKGVENYKEIVAVKGLNCVQSGRGDLSNAMGLPGGRLHPKVLDLERRIVEGALEAGKQVSLGGDLSPRGLEYVAEWMEKGVRCFSLGADATELIRAYDGALGKLRKEPVTA